MTYWCSLCFLAISLWASSLKALTGTEVMTAVDHNNKSFETMRSEALMVIRDSEGGTRERNFNHLVKYKDALRKSLIKFYLPATVKGTSLLTHAKDGEQDNTQWIYFPALKALNQIKGGKKKESFMGSDFTYADVAGRQLNQDTHTLLKEDEKYYYVRSIPNDTNDLYSKITLLVDKNMPVPLKIIFYDQDRKKLKSLTNKKVTKIEETHIVTSSIMENHQTGGKTELTISNIERNIPISDNDVGIKGLKQ